MEEDSLLVLLYLSPSSIAGARGQGAVRWKQSSLQRRGGGRPKQVNEIKQINNFKHINKTDQ